MRTTQTDNVSANVPAVFPTLQILYSSGLNGRAISLRHGATPIGRDVSEDQGVGLPDDDRASRLHASIMMTESETNQSGAPMRIRLVDQKSKNGSYVNGLLAAEAELRNGDVIRIGNSLLLLRYQMARHVDADVTSIIGQSPGIIDLRCHLVEIATLKTTVLLLGETGVGKDIAARALHRLSKRPGPFIAVNCAAIPRDLAEKELFGHIAGAFTGASRASSGYFRAADQGTLFLDEICEMPIDLQPKLLRVLEDRAVVPVGMTQALACDAFVIAATNRNIKDFVDNGEFRADLYARLSGAEITIPPLRERREDILPLLAYYLRDALGDRPLKLTGRLAEALLVHHWPYNVRELVKLALVMSPHAARGTELDLPLVQEKLSLDTISDDSAASLVAPSVPHTPPRRPSAQPRGAKVDAKEVRLSREVLIRLAEESKWNISAMSRVAGRSRRQIRRWLEHHGLVQKD